MEGLEGPGIGERLGGSGAGDRLEVSGVEVRSESSDDGKRLIFLLLFEDSVRIGDEFDSFCEESGGVSFDESFSLSLRFLRDRLVFSGTDVSFVNRLLRLSGVGRFSDGSELEELALLHE